MKRPEEETIGMIGEAKGATEKEMLEKMQIVIDKVFSSPDPEARAAWKDVPYKGDKPTTEELMQYIASKVKKWEE